MSAAAETFAKEPAPARPPEDADGNGLTERPSIRWLLWCSEAITAFCNGVFSGAGTGTAVGAGNALRDGAGTPQTLTLAAALGFALAAGTHGLKHFVVWHAANPMPNPFRP